MDFQNAEYFIGGIDPGGNPYLSHIQAADIVSAFNNHQAMRVTEVFIINRKTMSIVLSFKKGI